MPLTLIEQNPSFSKKEQGTNKLAISEMFCDTIQGEGISTGVPSTFMRLQGCTLKCVWCDTLNVWPNGNEYTYSEILDMFFRVGLVNRLRDGQHLILTGGSPLKQQDRLVGFIGAFIAKFGFKPFIEVENECVLVPSYEFMGFVDQWNNSPKLDNSGMKERIRYKPEAIKRVADDHNSWFKFVVSKPEDWEEISRQFLPLISRRQIILMPKGETQEELNKSRSMAADMAIEHGVRFSDRLHVTIWNKQTGV